MLALLQNYISLGSGFWVNLTFSLYNIRELAELSSLWKIPKPFFPPPIFVFWTTCKEIEMPKAHNYGADYLSLMAAICNFIVPM